MGQLGITGSPATSGGTPESENKKTFLDLMIMEQVSNKVTLIRLNSKLLSLLNKIKGDEICLKNEIAGEEGTGIANTLRMIQNQICSELKILSELLTELEEWI